MVVLTQLTKNLKTGLWKKLEATSHRQSSKTGWGKGREQRKRGGGGEKGRREEEGEKKEEEEEEVRIETQGSKGSLGS